MNGVHDMGGMDGFGPVRPEPTEPVFHAAWEGRVYAFTRALGYAGEWTLDESRHTQERLPPAVYLAVSYYKRWALGFERLLVAHGLVSERELAAGRSLEPGRPLRRRLAAAIVPDTLRRGSFARPAPGPPGFAVGERVRTKNIHPHGATRLPRYARDKTGTITRVQGCHVFPDAVVRGDGEDPQWLYTVVFHGTDLWGADSDPTVMVSIEAFEPYLERLA